MEYINEIGTQGVAPDELIRSDGTIYTFDHITEVDDQGSTLYKCKGWFLTPFDLSCIQQGNIPDGFQWDGVLHKLFRTHQHQRADNEYVYAERMFRESGDEKWNSYISSLDQWNSYVSNTASDFSTEIPALPDRP